MDKEKIAAYCFVVAAISAHARAKALSYDNKNYREPYPDIEPHEVLYCHEHMSTYEHVADLLEKMSILRPLDKFCLVFTCPPEQEYGLAEIHWSRGPILPHVLKLLIELFGNFGSENWGFETARNTSFEPKRPALTLAMQALVGLGYVKKRADGFRWTNKAKPIIAKAGFPHQISDPRHILPALLPLLPFIKPENLPR